MKCASASWPKPLSSDKQVFKPALASKCPACAIAPGYFEIELTAPLKSLPLYQEVIMRTAAGRWGNPDKCAGTAVFLAVPVSDFVTGQVIVVDGGRTLV